MKNIMNSRKKYLLLLPIILMICSSMFFKYANDEMMNVIMSEKFIELRAAVNMISTMVDRLVERDNDWETYDYSQDVVPLVEAADDRYATFAVLYNDQYQPVSQRQTAVLLDDPFAYPNFVSSVKANNNGEVDLQVTDADKNVNNFKMYFQWLPTDAKYQHRYLVVAGLCEQSITVKPASLLGIDMMLVIGATFFANLALVVMLIHSANKCRECAYNQNPAGRGSNRRRKDGRTWPPGNGQNDLYGPRYGPAAGGGYYYENGPPYGPAPAPRPQSGAGPEGYAEPPADATEPQPANGVTVDREILESLVRALGAQKAAGPESAGAAGRKPPAKPLDTRGR
ncbi:MAG: hypothetical protein FWC55_00515 [Firmicutes bacterium]|nr:hypothetical protein [Bacillota bacterium]